MVSPAEGELDLMHKIVRSAAPAITAVLPAAGSAGAAHAVGEFEEGATVASAGNGSTILTSCQSIDRQGTPGLLGSLGLGSENPTAGVTCTPAAISSH
ncbi:hypothetical protein ACFQ6N_17515 [Kitasatospora sp. NPDC056446]|uniref:hypothetical protein n=1 Tax=Kitasatospora sp. NPDC056446 TaxID=3345819 RepID=UPI003684A437